MKQKKASCKDQYLFFEIIEKFSKVEQNFIGNFSLYSFEEQGFVQVSIKERKILLKLVNHSFFKEEEMILRISKKVRDAKLLDIIKFEVFSKKDLFLHFETKYQFQLFLIIIAQSFDFASYNQMSLSNTSWKCEFDKLDDLLKSFCLENPYTLVIQINMKTNQFQFIVEEFKNSYSVIRLQFDLTQLEEKHLKRMVCYDCNYNPHRQCRSITMNRIY